MTQILTSLSYPPSSSSHQPLSIGSCSRQFFIDQHWLNNESTDGGPTWSVISPISFDLNHQSNTVLPAVFVTDIPKELCALMALGFRCSIGFSCFCKDLRSILQKSKFTKWFRALQFHPQHPAQYDLNIFQKNRQVHFTLIIKPESCLHCEPAAQEAPLLLWAASPKSGDLERVALFFD